MLKEAGRRVIDALLDQIIPASADGKVPAAGRLGVADFVLKNGGDDPALHQIIDRAQELTLEGNPMDAALVQRLEAEHPQAFATLQRLTYMGYYSRADIRPLFGLSALPVHPRGYDVPLESPELLEALVAPVKARGGLFRDC
jgi:hypothetical protein